MKLSALLFVFIATAAVADGAYRWVDKNGKVYYGDAPPLPAEVRQVEQKKLNPSVISSGGKLSYETRQAAGKFPVTLYTTPGCDPGCKDGRAFLKQRGIPFTEKVLKTAEDVAAFTKVTGAEALLAPTLLVGTESQKGYAADAWANLLGAAGYPATP